MQEQNCCLRVCVWLDLPLCVLCANRDNSASCIGLHLHFLLGMPGSNLVARMSRRARLCHTNHTSLPKRKGSMASHWEAKGSMASLPEGKD